MHIERLECRGRWQSLLSLDEFGLRPSSCF
jgi:hypothetical protein